MAAQDTALGTMEILENILLRLDIKYILTSAQRVCHQWQDLISTSPSLRKHLFLQPDWDRKDRERNPLLAEVFPDWFPDFPTSDKKPKGHRIETSAGDIKSSWKDMLVQQPPIRDIVFFAVRSGRGGTWVGGPYTDFADGSKTHRSSVTDPLTMDHFIYQVPLSGGSYWETMVLWDNEEHQIPPEIRFYSFNEKERRFLRGALEENGMILLEYSVVQCGKGVPGRARPRREYGTPFSMPQVDDTEAESEAEDDEEQDDSDEDDDDDEEDKKNTKIDDDENDENDEHEDRGVTQTHLQSNQ